MILKKLGTEYKLYGEDDSCIATTQESPHKKLSKENCDKVFGVADVEKLASEYAKEANDISAKYGVKVFGDNNYTPFKDGFNKAMELNKDKVFTLEDIKTAIDKAKQGHIEETYVGYGRPTHPTFVLDDLSYDEIIQSLQQPMEIEVEIEQVLVQSSIQGEAIWRYKLDENLCLILKKL